MQSNFLEIICFVVMLGIVFFVWFRHDGSLRRTIAYTVWTFVIFWVNMPCFFVGTENLELKNNLFVIPFELYNLLDLGYVIFGNILLAIAGIWIGKSWGKIVCVDEKTIKKRFDSFSNDACELKVIGRDLNYLGNEDYLDQSNHIKKLKDKAKLLCEQTDNPKLIKLYQGLIKDGNQVRYYTKREGIANLKAQIKIDMHRNEYGLFATKIDYSSSKKFEVNNLDSGFLLHTVSKEFDRIFKNSLNPVIKCIALDMGGVYFDGDLDEFYEFLINNYDIKMAREKQDKLNINDKLMLGEIDVQKFIKEKTTTKYKCNQLKQTDWEDIAKQWSETWKPNNNLKKLFEYIGTEGFYVVPFSNLDRNNGNKYLREYYLPACCTEHFFSYEQDCCKPTKDSFKKFFDFVKKKYDIQYPFQILLIDDQDKNISMAREQEWYSIKYINGKDDMDYLIDELKKNGLIPGDFDISKI